jgi:purine-cytosine permease-like protein
LTFNVRGFGSVAEVPTLIVVILSTVPVNAANTFSGASSGRPFTSSSRSPSFTPMPGSPSGARTAEFQSRAR